MGIENGSLRQKPDGMTPADHAGRRDGEVSRLVPEVSGLEDIVSRMVCYARGAKITNSTSGKALRTLVYLVFIIVFLAGDCKSPTGPGLHGGVLATFALDAHNEQYSIFITNTETIREVYALQNGQSKANIPNGPVVKGAVSYNKPWSWHIDGELVSMAEVTAEICDGWCALVESQLDSWAGNCFGPWAARLVSIKDYR
jgi:hypothetical protein